MKKFSLYIMTICVLCACYPLQSKAEKPVVTTSLVTTTSEPEQLINRLNEIKSMNISALNKSDRKKLRTEVLSIQDQLSKKDGGLYLSVGAIIIILLLLIIIL